MFVPVVDKKNKPLMPTTPARAKKWIKSKKATPFWKKGVFCVRLNVEPSAREKQNIVVGIDPGSKKEGYSVKSRLHTYLNIQADAVWWVKDAVKTRREMRRTRRQRKTPYRKCRYNRNKNKNFLTPSTKARWLWKLRVVNWISKIFPISYIIVEDIKAVSKKGQKKWNKIFSPLQYGKNWFYGELRKNYKLTLKQGYETKKLRDKLELKKSSQKLSNKFEAHCIDSWVLANEVVGGHIEPDNKEILFIVPLRFHRRQLHYLRPGKNGDRKFYGGTRSLGLKRGSLIKHKKYGLCYVGGTSKGRVRV